MKQLASVVVGILSLFGASRGGSVVLGSTASAGASSFGTQGVIEVGSFLAPGHGTRFDADNPASANTLHFLVTVAPDARPSPDASLPADRKPHLSLLAGSPSTLPSSGGMDRQMARVSDATVCTFPR